MAFDSRYDGMGRLKTHKLQIQLKEISSRVYKHDEDGRLAGIDDVPQNYYFQYAYSGAGRLTSSRHQIRGWLDEHAYHFDPAGNRIDKAKADSPIEDWQRVVQEHMGDPHFDMLGYVESHKNRPQVPMYEDNRVTEFEGTKNTYDAAGCLIEQTRPDRTKLRLHYDGAYRLVYIEKTNPDGKQTKISYAYDAISRRVFKGVTEEGKPQEVTRYGWDGDRCVYEETADQKITILYLPGTFSPFARIVQKVYPAPESDDPERDKAVDDAWKMVEKIMGRPLKKPQIPEKELEVQFFIPDHAGTPLFLVDAKGEILWEALPDDWKAAKEVELVKLLVSEYGVRQFIRFQGQWADEETGFYYNRHRYYDPAVGRYISQDPIGLAGGTNPYEYTGNPVSMVDPLGLAATLSACAAGPVGCAAGAGVLVVGAIASMLLTGDTENTDEAGVKIDPAAQGLSDRHQATNKDRTKPGYGGNCTPDEYDRLDAEKDKNCGEQERLTGDKLTCHRIENDKSLYNYEKNRMLEERGKAFGKCAHARENLMNACFAGGDKVHRKAAIQARQASNNCFNKIKH
jgi:RHS repeat-associated protein